jgi:GTP pyrophosphokinase
VQVLISANDREGLMRDVGTVVAAEGVNMLSVHIGTDRSVATFHTEMEIAAPEQLICVLAKLEQLPNIRDARRLSFKVPHVNDN